MTQSVTPVCPSHAAVIHVSGEARSVIRKYVNDGVSQHGRHHAYCSVPADENAPGDALVDPTSLIVCNAPSLMVPL
jgi:hypothetical protein